MVCRHFRAVASCALPLIIMVLFALPGWAAFRVPDHQGYVNDLAGVLSPEVETHLTQLAEELNRKAQAQMAILTVETLDGTPVETAALATARTWKVGSRKAGNRGMLLFFAIQDRKMRVEVGYGLEGTITDGTAGEVADQFFRPYFRQGEYDSGVFLGAATLAQKIATEQGVSLETLNETFVPSPTSEAPSHTVDKIPPPLLLLIFLGIIVFLVVTSRMRGGGGGWSGGSWGGGFGSSDGGGFGGFGGGDFGGGGASRDW